MELIHDEISLKILEAARSIAQKKNIGKVTVRDILKELNLSNRVFYNRYHNLEEVLGILYRESVEKVRESLALPWDGQEDFFGHICEIAERTLELTYESREHLSSFFFTADGDDDGNYTWWSQEILKLIRIGKERNLLKPELPEEAIGYAFWCFIRGFGLDALNRGMSKEEALKRFSESFHFFLEGMKVG